MNPLDLVPLDVDGLLSRPGLLSAGLLPGEIDRLVRTGLLRPVRRGTYLLDAEADTPADPRSAHLLRARATAPHVATSAAFGHVTAALALRLPVWGVPLERVHLVRERDGGGGHRRLRTHVHRAPLPEEDVVELGGLRLTSPARTVADLARTEPAEQALVTLDAALHEQVRRLRRDELRGPGATTVERVAEVLDRFAGRCGTPAARRLLAFADAGAESPGESRSRFHMHRAGIPAPVVQWEVPGLPFRTDFAWPDLGVVGEFDGRVKYGRALRPGQDPGAVFWEEKQREDRIRATGLRVVRWIWVDITGPMAARIAEQLGHRGTP